MTMSIGRHVPQLYDARLELSIRQRHETIYRTRPCQQNPASNFFVISTPTIRALSKKSLIVLTIRFFSLSATNITSAIPRGSFRFGAETTIILLTPARSIYGTANAEVSHRRW